jgi:hypothetical protein
MLHAVVVFISKEMPHQSTFETLGIVFYAYFNSNLNLDTIPKFGSPRSIV